MADEEAKAAATAGGLDAPAADFMEAPDDAAARKAKKRKEKKKKREEQRKQRQIIANADTDKPFGHFASATPAAAPTVDALDSAEYVTYEAYRFCDVLVDDPLKIGDGMGAYTVYRLSCRCTTKDFPAEINIRLRYSHFHAFREALVESHPTVQVPDLPPKQIFGRFAPDFVQKRAEGLTRFMDLVVTHAVFGKSPHLDRLLRTNVEIPSDNAGPAEPAAE